MWRIPENQLFTKSTAVSLDPPQISKIPLPGVRSASVAASCHAHLFPFKHGWILAGFFFFGSAQCWKEMQKKLFSVSLGAVFFFIPTQTLPCWFFKRDLTEQVLQRLSDKLYRGAKVNLFTWDSIAVKVLRLKISVRVCEVLLSTVQTRFFPLQHCGALFTPVWTQAMRDFSFCSNSLPPSLCCHPLASFSLAFEVTLITANRAACIVPLLRMAFRNLAPRMLWSGEYVMKPDTGTRACRIDPETSKMMQCFRINARGRVVKFGLCRWIPTCFSKTHIFLAQRLPWNRLNNLTVSKIMIANISPQLADAWVTFKKKNHCDHHRSLCVSFFFSGRHRDGRLVGYG